jgi:hypothetical protein
MRTFITAIAFALAACSPAAPPVTSEAPETAVQTAAAGAKPNETPATAAPGAITAEALVGRWGDNGDCTKDIVFAADGTFRSYTGGSGRWSLNGSSVTMAGEGGAFVVQVESVNASQLIVGNPDGSFGISQRC